MIQIAFFGTTAIHTLFVCLADHRARRKVLNYFLPELSKEQQNTPPCSKQKNFLNWSWCRPTHFQAKNELRCIQTFLRKDGIFQRPAANASLVLANCCIHRLASEPILCSVCDPGINASYPKLAATAATDTGRPHQEQRRQRNRNRQTIVDGKSRQHRIFWDPSPTK